MPWPPWETRQSIRCSSRVLSEIRTLNNWIVKRTYRPGFSAVLRYSRLTRTVAGWLADAPKMTPSALPTI